jgi:hypothetical protein
MASEVVGNQLADGYSKAKNIDLRVVLHDPTESLREHSPLDYEEDVKKG